jgi:4'-phosphopantetheinyl transferase
LILPDKPELMDLHTSVHVWRLAWRRDVPPASAWMTGLAEDERAQVERFHFSKDQLRYAYTHQALRRVLSGYLSLPPQILEYRRNPYGKPYLADDPQLYFNLSHTDERALIAVTRAGEVGVDLEKIKPEVPCLEIARRFFSRGEVAALARLPLEEQTDAFFRGWTRKEAFIKAVGRGLALPLDAFEVSLEDAPAQALLAVRKEAAVSGRWTIRNLAAERGYRAALAIQGDLTSMPVYEQNFFL